MIVTCVNQLKHPHYMLRIKIIVTNERPVGTTRQRAKSHIKESTREISKTFMYLFELISDAFC